MNLSEIVDRYAQDMPDQPALVFEDQTISYAELLRSINKLSNALVKAGVKKGDRVVILMGNRPEFVKGYYACMRIGAIVVTLNPLSTAYELSHYLADCKPTAVLCKGDQIPKIETIRDRADYLKTIISTERVDGAVHFDEIEKDFSDRFTALSLDPNDPAVVIFTAGLLGRALGATLSHHNLDTNSNLLRDQCGRGPETRGLSAYSHVSRLRRSGEPVEHNEGRRYGLSRRARRFSQADSLASRSQDNLQRLRSHGLLRSSLPPFLQGPGPFQPRHRHKRGRAAFYGNI